MKEEKNMMFNISYIKGENYSVKKFYSTPRFKNIPRKRGIVGHAFTDPEQLRKSKKARAVANIDFALRNNFNLTEKNTLLTFTISNEVCTYDILMKCFKDIMRALKRQIEIDLLKEFKFVWVLDFNKSGFYHVHLLTNFNFDQSSKLFWQKKWNKKVIKEFGLTGNSRAGSLNFTSIFSSEHLENEFLYLIQKVKKTYSDPKSDDKQRYSTSRNLGKKEKNNEFKPFNLKDEKKNNVDKYGRNNVIFSAYIDYNDSGKVYIEKINKFDID